MTSKSIVTLFFLLLVFTGNGTLDIDYRLRNDDENIKKDQNKQIIREERVRQYQYAATHVDRLNMEHSVQPAVSSSTTSYVNVQGKALCAMATAISSLVVGANAWKQSSTCPVYAGVGIPAWCSWNGIVCINGVDVSNVTISSGSYATTLPTLMCNLTSLRTLSLSSIGGLTGTIPKCLNSMTSLQSIYVFNMPLVRGSLPSLGGLMSLTSLNIQYMTSITGTVPSTLSTLTNLQSLYLYNLPLVSNSLPNLAALTQLKTLIIDKMGRLTGTLPNLHTLSQLQTLYLIDLNMRGSLPDLTSLTSLKSLVIDTLNSLTGTIPSLSTLTNLQYLYISDVSVRGTLPSLPSTLTSLSMQYMNNLIGSLPTTISLLTSIQSIYIDHLPGVIGTLPILNNLAALKQLSINNLNSLSGTLPTLNNLNNLQSLNFAHLSCKGTIPNLNGLSSLVYLSLYSMPILTGTLPSVASLTKLQSLAMFDLPVYGTLPVVTSLTALSVLQMRTMKNMAGSIPSVSTLTGLVSLSFGGMPQVSGSIPATIASMNSLTELDIDSMPKFMGCIPTTIGSLSTLKTLLLYSLSLDNGCVLPSFIKNIALAQISFSNMGLAGSIPSWIWTLPSLKALDLSYNALTSLSLPVSFPSSVAYNYINLINNSFSGISIPSAFCNNEFSGAVMYVRQNKFTCAPICFRIDPSEVYGWKTPHCIDTPLVGQDAIMCRLASTLNVKAALSTSFVKSYTTIIENPNHGYIPTGYEKIIEVQTSLFSVYEWDISFDTQTFLFGLQIFICDMLDFSETSPGYYYSAYAPCRTVLAEFNYYHSQRSMVIQSSTFVVYFVNAGPKPVNSYGFKMTATARSYPGSGWSCTTDSTGQSYATGLCDVAPGWTGVECDSGKVIGLSLKNLQLVGTLPTGLGQLDKLISLDLSQNYFNGTLPSSMLFTAAYASTLQTLDLSSNLLGGPLPSITTKPITTAVTTSPFTTATYAHMSNSMVPSTLSQNSHKRKEQHRQLSTSSTGIALQMLSLASNSFTGTIPTAFNTLSSIKTLDLGHNKLSGPISSALCSIRNASINVANNPQISCFQSACWEDSGAHLIANPYVRFCAPSGQPTSHPTHPTAKPTSLPAFPASVLLTITIVVVVIGGVICLGIVIGCVLYRRSETFVKGKLRRKMLAELPLHTMLYNKASEEDIMAYLNDKDFDANMLAKKDVDERNAFHIAILPQCNYSNRVVGALLEHLLPVKEGAPVPGSTHEIVPTSFHGDAWFHIVVLDQYSEAVEYILTHHSTVLDEALAKACDEHGRRAVDIASLKNKKILKQCMYLFKTYELITARNAPHHRSETCMVHLAYDRSVDEGIDQKVALKFMKHKEQFEREVEVRQGAGFSDEYVINVLRTIDGEEDYEMEFINKGFGDYQYLIVMTAGDRSLAAVIASEHIAGKDYDQIKMATLYIARALQHIHSKDLVHGDLKPHNIVRSSMGTGYRLIDFDASVHLGPKAYCGLKYTSGYIPPEMIHVDVHGNACIREVRSTHDYLPSDMHQMATTSPPKLGLSEKQKSLRFEKQKMISFKG